MDVEDFVVIYFDGLFEVVNLDECSFGYDKFMKILCVGGQFYFVCECIFFVFEQYMQGFELQDDFLFVVLKCQFELLLFLKVQLWGIEEGCVDGGFVVLLIGFSLDEQFDFVYEFDGVVVCDYVFVKDVVESDFVIFEVIDEVYVGEMFICVVDFGECQIVCCDQIEGVDVDEVFGQC